MLDWVFLKGLAIGFLIAAPVGPVNVLCVRRTLVHGRLAGLASGLGAALADTLFGAVAAFGVLFVAEFLIDHQRDLVFAGAAFLIVLGVRTLLKPPPELTAGRDPTGLVGDLTSTFLLTLTNPITIFSFIGVYVAFGIQPDGRIDVGDWLLLGGVFGGALAWWVLITSLAAFFRARFTAVGLLWANRIAGIVILLFAAVVLWDAFGGPFPRLG
jgi:threonine/homoserine/homoserine lactone efflux protein